MFTDRLVMDIQYGHVGNNFALTFQDPAQREIQPTFDIPTELVDAVTLQLART